ncbi:Phosphoglycerate mutase [Solidesulfovibrio fructosivorans JJ]]|uniref:Phosphoglycerate mutase n=1 Tax=Solidesulfovibrio fructosivorans JJ] TaxID=596151 RepID=E1K0K8_SOLFR|nr:histidine phosphatase family protein [Solidesulfovibrio fructosivorans]EFL49860.1 Phosphoglycerate mutase [Solidesulfovibrio fructosivorans JJ]]
MPLFRLIRHGQSASNAGHVTDYPDTIPLTDLGQRQAALVASCFRRAPRLVVFSSFDRAVQTATPLCERFPEASVAVWPVQEFTYLAPHRYIGTTRKERGEAVVAYWKRLDPRWRDGDGAESFVGFWDRVESFMERVARTRGPAVVFSHGQFLRGVVLRVLAGPLGAEEAMVRFRAVRQAVAWPNAAMAVLAVSPAMPLIGPVTVEHLPPEMLST